MCGCSILVTQRLLKKEQRKNSHEGHLMTSYLLEMTFLTNEIKHCYTDGRSVWTARENFENRLHLVTFIESILAYEIFS